MKAPKFVKFKDGGSACRLIGSQYYRDGGNWSMDFRIEDNRIFAVLKMVESIHGRELVECTEEEWKKCNGQYVPNNY